MKLKAFAKTSGSKGLQVYCPLNTPVTFDQTKDLSRALGAASRTRASAARHLQNVEGVAQRKNLRRLEPERRTQDDDLRLFPARKGTADRLDSGELEGSGKRFEKEECEASYVHIRSSLEAGGEARRSL